MLDHVREGLGNGQRRVSQDDRKVAVGVDRVEEERSAQKKKESVHVPHRSLWRTKKKKRKEEREREKSAPGPVQHSFRE